MEARFESIQQLGTMLDGFDKAEIRDVNIGQYRPENFLGVWNTSRELLLLKGKVILSVSFRFAS